MPMQLADSVATAVVAANAARWSMEMEKARHAAALTLCMAMHAMVSKALATTNCRCGQGGHVHDGGTAALKVAQTAHGHCAWAWHFCFSRSRCAHTLSESFWTLEAHNRAGIAITVLKAEGSGFVSFNIKLRAMMLQTVFRNATTVTKRSLLAVLQQH